MWGGVAACGCPFLCPHLCPAPPSLLQLPPVDKGELDSQKAAELAVQNLEEKLVR